MSKKNEDKLAEIGERLKKARKHLDLGQSEFAEKVGMSLRGYQSNERGLTTPSALLLSELAEMGISPLWIISGKGNMSIQTGAKAFYKRNSDLVETTKLFSYIINNLCESEVSEDRVNKLSSLYAESGITNESSFFNFIQELSKPFSPYVFIPFLNDARKIKDVNKNSAELINFYPVRKSWINKLELKVKNIKAFLVEDDSMEPTAKQGDVALVYELMPDAANGLFILNVNGTPSIRRLEHKLTGIAVSSDNENYSDEFIENSDSNLIVRIGKVLRIDSE